MIFFPFSMGICLQLLVMNISAILVISISAVAVWMLRIRFLTFASKVTLFFLRIAEYVTTPTYDPFSSTGRSWYFDSFMTAKALAMVESESMVGKSVDIIFSTEMPSICDLSMDSFFRSSRSFTPIFTPRIMNLIIPDIKPTC